MMYPPGLPRTSMMSPSAGNSLSSRCATSPTNSPTLPSFVWNVHNRRYAKVPRLVSTILASRSSGRLVGMILPFGLLALRGRWDGGVAARTRDRPVRP